MGKNGRPTKYKPEFVEAVEAHLSQGFTLASFGGQSETTRETLYNWAEQHEEFFHAIKKGRAKGQLVWEARLSKQAEDGAGNTAAIIFAMKNLYQDDWADKIVNEMTGKDGQSLSFTILPVSVNAKDSPNS